MHEKTWMKKTYTLIVCDTMQHIAKVILMETMKETKYKPWNKAMPGTKEYRIASHLWETYFVDLHDFFIKKISLNTSKLIRN